MNVAVDGHGVFVHTGGEPFDAARPAVVLVHGAGMDHSVWRYQSRRLAASGWAVVAPDLPGHGRSGGDLLASIAAMGAWVGRLTDVLGVVRPVIVGHSLGSLVALWVAAHGEVAGVVLFGPSDHMLVHPDLQDAADRRDRLAIDLILGWTHTGDSRLGGHLEAGSWKRALLERLLERHLEGALAIDLRAVSRHDPVADAVDAEVPALVVLGSADRMTPVGAGRALASHLAADAELLEIDGGSHVVFLEQPTEVMPALLSWLSRVHPAS